MVLRKKMKKKEVREDALSRVKSGEKVKVVAENLGVSTANVYYWIKASKKRKVRAKVTKTFVRKTSEVLTAKEKENANLKLEVSNLNKIIGQLSFKLLKANGEL